MMRSNPLMLGVADEEEEVEVWTVAVGVEPTVFVTVTTPLMAVFCDDDVEVALTVAGWVKLQ